MAYGYTLHIDEQDEDRVVVQVKRGGEHAYLVSIDTTANHGATAIIARDDKVHVMRPDGTATTYDF